MSRSGRLAAWLAGAGLAGVLVLVSGVVDVGADDGHWPVTNWLLHFAMRRSVQTHALGIEVPPLDDPWLARRGAGHYARECADCHGAPGVARAATVLGMTPPPPELGPRIAAWDPAELFWIVRHGVKFTAMPPWPARAREDEVWSVVAFLLRLPELDAAAYRRLADGATRRTTAGAGADALAHCVGCHGLDGRGDGAFPRLAGQSERYLLASLRAYAERRRESGMMQSAARRVDSTQMAALARHYARAAAPSAPAAPAADAALAREGERLARHGDPVRGVPPCASCHGVDDGPRFSEYPRLAGQQAWYLATQLELFRAGERGGTPYGHVMQAAARNLSERQIAAVAAFYGRPAPPWPDGGRQ